MSRVKKAGKILLVFLIIALVTYISHGERCRQIYAKIYVSLHRQSLEEYVSGIKRGDNPDVMWQEYTYKVPTGNGGKIVKHDSEIAVIEDGYNGHDVIIYKFPNQQYAVEFIFYQFGLAVSGTDESFVKADTEELLYKLIRWSGFHYKEIGEEWYWFQRIDD